MLHNPFYVWIMAGYSKLTLLLEAMIPCLPDMMITIKVESFLKIIIMWKVMFLHEVFICECFILSILTTKLVHFTELTHTYYNYTHVHSNYSNCFYNENKYLKILNNSWNIGIVVQSSETNQNLVRLLCGYYMWIFILPFLLF